MHIHAFSMYIPAGMLNRIWEQVPVMSKLTAQFHSQSLYHYAHAATPQHCSSDIITASSPLYKKLSGITEHAPETDA